jgi:hypothetical protein
MHYISARAWFSPCGQYRYCLQRRWSHDQGSVLFIGLNPSTADHRHDDATIRRCVRFARDWGYAAMEIVNLFAYRATYPTDLKQSPEPIGSRNDRWIARTMSRCDLAIACWGNDGDFLQRGAAIRSKYAGLSCLRVNGTGQPAHPLYLKAELLPIPLQTCSPQESD